MQMAIRTKIGNRFFSPPRVSSNAWRNTINGRGNVYAISDQWEDCVSGLDTAGDPIWRKIVIMATIRNWISKKNGYYQQIRDIYKNLNLTPCKKITVGFDPFRADSKDVRSFNYLITSYPASKSKLHITVRTEIYTDRSDPTVNIDLTNGDKIHMNCRHLKVKDIFELLHEHVTPLAPKETDVGQEKIKRKIHSKI